MSFRIVFPIVVLLALPAAAAPDSMAAHPNAAVILPDQVQWQGKPGGGSRSAVLVGDPAKPAAFVQLLDIPSNTISQPHFHSHDRTYMVVKGHWDLGTGPVYDVGAMRALPVGSVVTLPARGIIYDGCKQSPCVIEIIGEGQDPDSWVDKTGRPLSK